MRAWLQHQWDRFVEWLLGPETEFPAYDPWDETWL